MPPGPDPEQQPLLASDRDRLAALHGNDDIVACHIRKLHGDPTPVHHLRQRLQAFLASKWGHYFVIVLVSLDITAILANFMVQLHIADHTCYGDAPERGFDARPWRRVVEVLAIFSLIFSSLFMLELVGSLFAFGPSYFRSSFHIFDAIVIVAAFVVELLLSGPLEEAGSLIVALRLWRVFKIIEEFSAGAADEVEQLAQRVSHVEEELKNALRENEALRRRLEGDGNGRVNSHY